MILLSLIKIQAAEKIYNKVAGWRKIDELLYDTFKKYPENKNHDAVVFKVELVDSLYNCNLMMDKTKVGDEIISQKLDLFNGDAINNVNRIAEIKLLTANKRVGWVFSSKYCHFHRQEKYPIIDSFAKRAMIYLTGQTNNHYNTFENFKKAIDKMITEIDENITYKQMDIYLYLLGQWLDYKKGNLRISANILREINTDRDLFNHLI